VPVLCGYKCLGGAFKILILKYSPDFLFFIPLKAWVLKRVPLKAWGFFLIHTPENMKKPKGGIIDSDNSAFEKSNADT
jgi:hypothetical protein